MEPDDEFLKEPAGYVLYCVVSKAEIICLEDTTTFSKRLIYESRGCKDSSAEEGRVIAAVKEAKYRNPFVRVSCGAAFGWWLRLSAPTTSSQSEA